ITLYEGKHFTGRKLEHGEHFRLEIFEGCNFTGQCLEFKDDCPFLQSQGWAKNWVNAVKVYGDGAARVQSLRRVANFY
ncbi:hypothetical protein E2I00_013411, partial [Balaenoptera physalus]